MILSNTPFVKILQAIKIITFMMLSLEAEFFVGGSCWRIEDNIANGSCVEKERQALLKMKEAFVDDHRRLSSWGSSPDCCQWSGVHCNPHTGLVEKLDLYGDPDLEQPLRGEISPLLMELQNLNYLDISFNDFHGSEIPKFVGSLKRLRYLDLSYSSFEGKIPIELGKLLDLQVLNLSHNDLVGTIPFHLVNLSILQELNLRSNNLVGRIPYQLGNLSRLEKLLIGSNDDLKVDGIEWLSNLRSLTSLDLSDVFNLNYSNNLLPTIGKLPNLSVIWLNNCNLTDINILSTFPSHLNFSTSLLTLRLRENKLTSSLFTWLFNLTSNLARLDLHSNHLGGPLPDDFGKYMNSLELLSLRDNELNGTISEVHFGNLTRLQILDLSDNLLSLKFSNHWIPPFQLQELTLYQCKLGPGFPKWLRTQNNLQDLAVSDAEINDSIPDWFWRLLNGANFLQIVSSNLKGTIPDLQLEVTCSVLWLPSNQIEGSIPPILLKVGFLDISGNQISKFDLACGKGIGANVENLVALYLSDNNLSGELPDCWHHFKSLKFLDLFNNQLSGMIPNSISSLNQLEQLVLRNNCLSGGLPSLENATKLGMLDLGKNDLSGPIPTSWTTENLRDLETLSLRMNNLDGNLPFHLCYLTKLRIFDLSVNNFTGPIPSCLDKLAAMAQKPVINDSIRWIYFSKNGDTTGIYIMWYSSIMWKGTERGYDDRYGLLNIDLSHNQLVGEIPTEIGKLVELRFLNLSVNKLSGRIISEIGQLKSLEVLDLSRNHFDGEIPSSLAEIPSLSILDVSNNNLSGEIPTGTQLQSFDARRYEGNAYLCGRPLDKLCSSEGHPLGNGTQADGQVAGEDDSIMKGFFESLGVGFVVGFWIVFGSLLIVRSWRHAYFHFLNNLADSIYVATVLHVARWRRWLSN